MCDQELSSLPWRASEPEGIPTSCPSFHKPGPWTRGLYQPAVNLWWRLEISHVQSWAELSRSQESQWCNCRDTSFVIQPLYFYLFITLNEEQAGFISEASKGMDAAKSLKVSGTTISYLCVSVCVWIPTQFSHSVMSSFLQRHGLQYIRPPCPSPTPRA